jgi:hypothetical protein
MCGGSSTPLQKMFFLRSIARPSTFLAYALCQSQRVALGEPDAPGADPVDHACLGAAIPDGIVALERYYQHRGRSPRTLLDRARQAVRLVRHWLPEQELVVVDDSAYAALEWLDPVRHAVCVIHPLATRRGPL